MKERVRRWALPWLVRQVTVPVADCVHYGAFRYGRREFNPYENYAVALAAGGDMAAARARFVEFLEHYRPEDFGAALGVELSRPQPLWRYPWAPEPDEGEATPGWLENPADAPDILTYFSRRGILRTRIDEEFGWLERAFNSIREHGYQPGRFAGHLEARKLVALDGSVRYLITDGNHRLSALAALGQRTVVVRYRWRMTVKERALPQWPLVRSGLYSAEDARSVLRVYFDGNRRPRTTEEAAQVIDGPAA